MKKINEGVIKFLHFLIQFFIFIFQNQFSDDDLMNMLGSFGNPNGDPNELLPFMQQMMQSLLSKDILHPALISIIDKVWSCFIF